LFIHLLNVFIPSYDSSLFKIFLIIHVCNPTYEFIFEAIEVGC